MKFFLVVVIPTTLAVTLAQYQPGTGTGGGDTYSGGSGGGQGAARYNNVQQYNPPQYSGSDDQQKKLPFIAIVNHKQALGADGTFNFAFAADNGLQQGESIGPDGTRKGSYSYVDPAGKKITVKYAAGKDGFRILESPFQQPSAPIAAPVQGTPVPYNINQYKDGIFPFDGTVGKSQYGGSAAQQYNVPQQQTYQPRYQPTPTAATGGAQFNYYQNPSQYTRGPAQFPPLSAGGYQQSSPAGARVSTAVQPSPATTKFYAPSYPLSGKQGQTQDYEEDPNAPHSFGAGYSFEFAG